MINIYEEDYYRMALRRILGKVDNNLEVKFLKTVKSLKNMYLDVEIHDYVFYNKIV